MIVNHPSFNGASRSSYDQYRDMRLDVDSMSYEVVETDIVILYFSLLMWY